MSRSYCISMYAIFKHTQTIRSFEILPLSWNGGIAKQISTFACSNAIQLMERLARDSNYQIVPLMVFPTDTDSVELHYNLIIKYNPNKCSKLFFLKINVPVNNITNYHIYDSTENELFNGMGEAKDIDVNHFDNIRELIIQKYIKEN